MSVIGKTQDRMGDENKKWLFLFKILNYHTALLELTLAGEGICKPHI